MDEDVDTEALMDGECDGEALPEEDGECVELPLRGAQKASEVAPSVELHVPAGHGVHVLLSTAPSTLENVPGGHGVGVAEAPGQKEPGGHI